MIKKTMKTLYPLSIALLVSACGAGYQTGAGIDQRAEVSMIRLSHVIAPEATKTTDLSAETLDDVAQFLSMNSVGYGDIIVLDQGAGVDEKRIIALTAWLKQQGLTLGETNGVFGGYPMDGGITLYVERYVITNPVSCPNWNQDSTYNPNNAPMAQIGCATTSALDAAVANPRDLIDGQKGGNTNSAATKAADRHQKTGKGTGGNTTEGTGANAGVRGDQ